MEFPPLPAPQKDKHALSLGITLRNRYSRHVVCSYPRAAGSLSQTRPKGLRCSPLNHVGLFCAKDAHVGQRPKPVQHGVTRLSSCPASLPSSRNGSSWLWGSPDTGLVELTPPPAPPPPPSSGDCLAGFHQRAYTRAISGMGTQPKKQ